jgi:hypothetical protein
MMLGRVPAIAPCEVLVKAQVNAPGPALIEAALTLG